jgi:nucleoside-triphosphatase
MKNKIIIVTGNIQTGKTTFLQTFCEQQQTAGILTPIINQKRFFYDISKHTFFEMEANPTEEKLAIGKYLFSVKAFIHANNILLEASTREDIKYLIIDEIGPLEIKLQQGLYTSIKKIIDKPYKYTLLLVVRTQLVDMAIAHLKLYKPLIVDLNTLKTYLPAL